MALPATVPHFNSRLWMVIHTNSGIFKATELSWIDSLVRFWIQAIVSPWVKHWLLTQTNQQPLPPIGPWTHRQECLKMLTLSIPLVSTVPLPLLLVKLLLWEKLRAAITKFSLTCSNNKTELTNRSLNDYRWDESKNICKSKLIWARKLD